MPRVKTQPADKAVEKVSKSKAAKIKVEKKEEKKVSPNKEVVSKPVSAMDKLIAQSGVSIKALKRGDEVKGKITYITKSLVLVDIGAKTEGMVSDQDLLEASDMIGGLKVGDEIKAYIKYPENDQGQVVLSLRKALEESRWAMFDQWLDVEKEIEVKGLEVNKGGMIVAVDSIRGFVPTSQFGEKYLGKMTQLLNKAFKVKVIEVDRDQNRLIFSEKLVSDAQGLARKNEALNRVQVGETFIGTVSGIMPFGVFVTVTVPVRNEEGKDVGEAKVEGLVHISEISWEKVEDPNTLFKVGQEVEVQVIGIDHNVGKLNLSIKRLSDDPWTTIESRYTVGTRHSGKVIRIAPYGVLVNFERGVDGLIHISKQPAGSTYEIGQDVDVYVEMLDVKTRRMSLGVVLTEVPVGYR